MTNLSPVPMETDQPLTDRSKNKSHKIYVASIDCNACHTFNKRSPIKISTYSRCKPEVGTIDSYMDLLLLQINTLLVRGITLGKTYTARL